MKILKVFFNVLLLAVFALLIVVTNGSDDAPHTMKKVPCDDANFISPLEAFSVYDFSVHDLMSNRKINLSDFRGKALLIVNIATFSSETFQLHELNALHRNFENLEVLAFPCNQFGRSEPGANGTEIYHSLRYVRPGHNFQPHMHLFRKTDVNGMNELPLFTFLKAKCPPTRSYFHGSHELFYYPMRSSDIRWNFEKFLVNMEGQPIYRYDSETRAVDILKDIEKLQPPAPRFHLRFKKQ